MVLILGYWLRWRWIKCLRVLIFFLPSIDWFLQDGRSPIILAVQRDQLDVVELLQDMYHQPLPTAADLDNLTNLDHKTMIPANLEPKLVNWPWVYTNVHYHVHNVCALLQSCMFYAHDGLFPVMCNLRIDRYYGGITGWHILSPQVAVPSGC